VGGVDLDDFLKAIGPSLPSLIWQTWTTRGTSTWCRWLWASRGEKASGTGPFKLINPQNIHQRPTTLGNKRANAWPTQMLHEWDDLMFRCGCRCFWDSDVDRHASETFMNVSCEPAGCTMCIPSF
jgi:hypothetical protein